MVSEISGITISEITPKTSGIKISVSVLPNANFLALIRNFVGDSQILVPLISQVSCFALIHLSANGDTLVRDALKIKILAELQLLS